MGIDPNAPQADRPFGELDGVRLDRVRLSVAAEGLLDGPAEIVVEGARLAVSQAALAELVEVAAAEITARSRERIDALLAAMESHPRLRPVRWYYASLFRVAGVRDDLAIDAAFVADGIEVRARFAQGDPGNLLRQLRDRARNLATITARLHLAAVDGALHLRLDLSPDVNGLLANLVVNGLVRPGVTRVDGATATVRVDLAAVVAAQEAEMRPRPRLDCGVQAARITADEAVVELG